MYGYGLLGQIAGVHAGHLAAHDAIKGAHDREHGNRKIPNNSIDCLFTILEQIQADKRRTANAWVTRTITKKQRDMLALLGLENPPRVLKN